MNVLKFRAFIFVAMVLISLPNLYAQTIDTIRLKGVEKFIPDNVMEVEKPNGNFEIDDTNSSFNALLKKWVILKDKPQKVVDLSVYDKFLGRVIDTVIVVNNEIYQDLSDRKVMGFLQRNANNIHKCTRVDIIKDMLLFEEGQQVAPDLISKSQANLVESRYISNCNIVITPNGDYGANIYVFTRDKMSLGVALDHRRYSNSKLTLFESNFMGLGHKLGVNYYANRKTKDYFVGADVFYDMSNLYGTFWDIFTSLGYGGDDYYRAELRASKDIKISGDYMAGGNFLMYNGEWILENLKEQTTNVKYMDYGVWGGKSFYTGSDITPFVTADFSVRDFSEKPYVSSTFNPNFLDYTQLIFDVGVYEENFFMGNYIYGFGRTEAIPYGYKIQFSGGYRWEEFENKAYLGANLEYGNLFKWGYLNGQFEYATLLDNKSSLYPTNKEVYKFNLRYFSNLWEVQDDYFLRLFADVRYVTGNDTGLGEGAILHYETIEGRSKGDRVFGTTRINFKPEFVLFLPHHFLGFRMAAFVCGNLGVIGYSPNPFKGKFFADTSFGIRFRNESFFIKDIELRFLIGISTPDNYSQNVYYINNEPELRMNGFVPVRPQIIEYK